MTLRYRCHHCGSPNVFSEYELGEGWIKKCTSCEREYTKEQQAEDEIKIQEIRLQFDSRGELATALPRGRN